MNGIRYYYSKYFYTPIRRHIKYKMMLLMLLLTVIPSSIIAIIAYTNSKTTLEEQVIRQNDSTIRWVGNYMNSIVDDIGDSLIVFLADNELLDNINHLKVQQPDIQYTSKKYITNKLNNYFFSNHEKFNQMGLYLEEFNKTIIVSYAETTFSNSTNSPLRNEDYELLKDRPYKLIFNDSIAKNFGQGFTTTKEHFYILQRYNQFETRKHIATVALNVKWSIMDQPLNLLKMDDDEIVVLIDDKGEVIYDPYNYNSKQLNFKSILKKIENSVDKNYIITDNQFIFFENFSEHGYIIKIVQESTINNSFKKSINEQMLLMIIFIFIGIFTAIYISYKFTKPIISLATSMKDVEEHLTDENQVKLKVSKRNDEIKILEQMYVYMINKIKIYIQKEYKYKIDVQTAQFYALQAQINPHFMYNTLQMMGAMALNKDAPEVYKISQLFSSMMRYNMHYNKKNVSIKEEIENVKSYLEIQNLRFGNQLSCIYKLDSSLINNKIPKIILQPIVENCFKHGFKNKKNIWHIVIEVKRIDDFVVIKIADNGIGITKDALIKLKEDIFIEEGRIFHDTGKLGLSNINARIKLDYGYVYGITPIINENGGLTITIRLPYEVINND